MTGKTTSAVRLANKLATEGKKVLFVVHSPSMVKYVRDLELDLRVQVLTQYQNAAQLFLQTQRVCGYDNVVVDHYVTDCMLKELLARVDCVRSITNSQRKLINEM